MKSVNGVWKLIGLVSLGMNTIACKELLQVSIKSTIPVHYKQINSLRNRYINCNIELSKSPPFLSLCFILNVI